MKEVISYRTIINMKAFFFFMTILLGMMPYTVEAQGTDINSRDHRGKVIDGRLQNGRQRPSEPTEQVSERDRKDHGVQKHVLDENADARLLSAVDLQREDRKKIEQRGGKRGSEDRHAEIALPEHGGRHGQSKDRIVAAQHRLRDCAAPLRILHNARKDQPREHKHPQDTAEHEQDDGGVRVACVVLPDQVPKDQRRQTDIVNDAICDQKHILRNEPRARQQQPDCHHQQERRYGSKGCEQVFHADIIQKARSECKPNPKKRSPSRWPLQYQKIFLANRKIVCFFGCFSVQNGLQCR